MLALILVAALVSIFAFGLPVFAVVGIALAATVIDVVVSLAVDYKLNQKAKEVEPVAAVKADEKKPEAQAQTPAQGSARAKEDEKAQTLAQDAGTPGN